MATFNDLLREAGFDPQEVRLVRHKDTRLGRISVYDLWRNERQIFGYYQSVQQSRRSFPAGSQVASFVVDPGGQTLFVGLYDVRDRREASEADIDRDGKTPLEAKPYIRRLESHTHSEFYQDLLNLLRNFLAPGDCIHELKKRAELVNYEAVLAIDWGPGARAFVQRAHLRDKPILRTPQG
jgi:hypothetical protein